MGVIKEIESFVPFNRQEQRDREGMLLFMKSHEDYLERSNTTAHVTVSLWTVNADMSKVLMVYHNIYNSWSWIGGHADGREDLPAVALRELWEETGVSRASLVSPDIFSLEILAVNGHEKGGLYVSSHLHLNLT